MHHRTSLLIVIVGLGTGLLLSARWLSPHFSWQAVAAPNNAAQAVTESAMEHAKKHLNPKYVCPMHPEITKDTPGTCPICGMKLVPVEEEQGAAADKGAPEVKVSTAMLNTLAVRTGKAARTNLARAISTVGTVSFDEGRMVCVSLAREGWIKRLVVKHEGERVHKGELLFEYYAPDLVALQQRYLDAARATPQGSPALTRQRQELLLLGISEADLAGMEKSGEAPLLTKVYAPQDGVVVRLNQPEGMFVDPLFPVMQIADLSQVWVIADVVEQQAAWVQPGQSAEVRVVAWPGKSWKGLVDYVYPTLNRKTRTLRARLRFPNPEEVLKPNMYADVTIAGGAQEALTIPREALIDTGSAQRVVLALGEGRFKPVPVVAGTEDGERVEIVSGLKEGDAVVVSGQFLIDSESNLKAGLGRLDASEAK